ncbi:hypothetical protein EVAR_97234_1 [Eumeta japonica]|uniref:Uncharacterized protein n=1 Tax=Eumeta variegata TaxID=151549 RepID=A0A4C2A7Y5_EUMVA|nr:hypothetical protein EVAR_97234_1 [Eumeta japonica]
MRKVDSTWKLGIHQQDGQLLTAIFGTKMSIPISTNKPSSGNGETSTQRQRRLEKKRRMRQQKLANETEAERELDYKRRENGEMRAQQQTKHV